MSLASLASWRELFIGDGVPSYSLRLWAPIRCCFDHFCGGAGSGWPLLPIMSQPADHGKQFALPEILAILIP